MKIENIDRVRVLSSRLDTLNSMIRHIEDKERNCRLRLQLNTKADVFDDLIYDDRMLELFKGIVEKRIKEIEKTLKTL